jgi:hypothetical protein
MHLMTTAGPRVGRGALDGFDTVMLSAGELDAAFAPGAGMAGVSLRHAGEELLDRQACLRTYVERGAVMGIPILHPTGRHATQAVTAAKDVRGRGHRLEADELPAGGREDLRRVERSPRRSGSASRRIERR